MMHPAVTAVPVGIAFGFILERAGLGDARVIRGQLLGTDFSVILVMFGAIVTAMLGLLWFDALGLVDLAKMATPPTDAAAQVLGGIVFGGGFAIAALCPGTACVAAASGRRDGVAAVIGVFGGTLVTPLLWPALGLVASSAPAETRWLPTDLGVPTWVVAGAVVLLALAAVRLARMLTTSAPRASWWRLSTVETVALTLALAYGAVERRANARPAQLAALAGAIEREDDHVDAVELAQWIRDGRTGLRVIDVRDDVDTGTDVIPGAVVIPLHALDTLTAHANEHLVLYSDGGTHAAQAWVLLRMRGFRDVRVLKDGMAAWEDDVLRPVLDAGTDARSRQRSAAVRTLSLWFGGQPRVAMPGAAGAQRATAHAARPRRRNTC